MKDQTNHNERFNRKNTSSFKWDKVDTIFEAEDLLPMWVADMDWPSPPAVQDALAKRISHPIFGYTGPNESILDSIVTWMKNRHSWEINTEQIIFSPGIIPGIVTAIQALTIPGDSIMIQTPVYTPFHDIVRNNDRILVTTDLILEDNRFHINFSDFEHQLQKGIKLVILCSPHNPGGTVWKKADLQKMANLCLEYNVPILSDEIHGDLALFGNNHIPLASLSKPISENVITFMAPSKTFNIAGLQASVIITENAEFREKIKQIQQKQGMHGLNLLAYTALEAAYTHGEAWLTKTTHLIEENVEIAIDFIERELPLISPMVPEASFLMWLDLRKLNLSDGEIKKRLLHKGKLALEPGLKYGRNGARFVRINLGCYKDTLEEGLRRLKLSFEDLI